jgi:AraC family transcriptional regulator
MNHALDIAMKSEAIQEHARFNSRMSKLGVKPSISIADGYGMGFLAHATFDAGEGDYVPSPFLMLTLCTAHTGRMQRSGEGPPLEGILLPGRVAIALPNTSATGYWSKTQLLGIAVNPDVLAGTGNVITSDDLLPAASQLHDDPLLTSVMTALWRDAEMHGLSGAFFEQGIHVLLRRLTEFRTRQGKQSPVHPLKGARLQQVQDFMESRLGDDLRVTELAAMTGQDVRTFTRAFFAATGLAPYAYFTLRRMELAKRLLRDQQLPITDIALSAGYTNPSKFAAAFKRVCGMSPSTWRQN